MFQKPAIEYAQAVPRGVSYKTLMHLAQLGQSVRLAQQDYGPKINLEVYGSRESPEYNLTAVTTPVALLFSDGDAHISSEVCTTYVYFYALAWTIENGVDNILKF